MKVHTSLIENSRALLNEAWFDRGEALRYIFLFQTLVIVFHEWFVGVRAFVLQEFETAETCMTSHWETNHYLF
jgi:hypothetical protein